VYTVAPAGEGNKKITEFFSPAEEGDEVKFSLCLTSASNTKFIKIERKK